MPETPVAHDGHGAFFEHAVHGRVRCHSQAVTEHGVADVERRKRGKRVAADIGRYVICAEFPLDQFHRGKYRTLGAPDAKARRTGGYRTAEQFSRAPFRFGKRLEQLSDTCCVELCRSGERDETRHPRQHDFAGVLAGERQHVLAVYRGGRVCGAPQHRLYSVFDVGGLAFLDDQHRALARAEPGHLLRNHRVSDVHAVDRNPGRAKNVRKPELLKGADRAVVKAALAHNADVVGVAVKLFVQLVFLDELDCSWPAYFYLVLLLRVGRWRQADAAEVELGVFNEIPARVRCRTIGLGGEAALDMAGANAQLQEHRRTGRFGQFERFLHRLDDLAQIGARIEQPHLGFHRESVASFLDDRCAFAIVFAEHDQRTALHARRGQIGERIRGHVGPDGGFERDRTAQRIIDRSAEHGRGAGFGGIGLDVDAELIHDVACIVQHIHHVGHRCPLIAANIRHSGLQERLGDGENAFSMEDLALAKLEFLHFLLE